VVEVNINTRRIFGTNKINICNFTNQNYFQKYMLAEINMPIK